MESAVNHIVSKRFAKKQQMQWTKKGAPLLLQVRTQVLDERLEETFRGGIRASAVLRTVPRWRLNTGFFMLSYDIAASPNRGATRNVDDRSAPLSWLLSRC